ncbi:MAG: C40 family peptidase [Alphaproteobacteria bacterium]|nr:C40 family peptidase [Alphaproteobacteria bacterium]
MADAPLDPKRHAFRPDLADVRLRGRIEAARYVAGAPAQCRAEIAAVMAAPDAGSEQSSQLLWGETFTVFERGADWLWGQCAHDGYVGYVAPADLDDEISAPTHRVAVPRSFLFATPSVKSDVRAALPMMARIAVGGERDGYRTIGGGGWIHGAHIARFEDFEDDPVAVASRFLGVPYLWGGRTMLGIDCSGLVQIALQAIGIFAPRDSYMQETEIGDAVDIPADPAQLRRGDLVFFPGHVGFVDGAGGYLHASSHAGAVSLHPLADVVARAQRVHGHAISAVRRLPPI